MYYMLVRLSGCLNHIKDYLRPYLFIQLFQSVPVEVLLQEFSEIYLGKLQWIAN